LASSRIIRIETRPGLSDAVERTGSRFLLISRWLECQ
jgi:hypothetical protein